jgi:hypothetical protein
MRGYNVFRAEEMEGKLTVEKRICVLVHGRRSNRGCFG